MSEDEMKTILAALTELRHGFAEQRDGIAELRHGFAEQRDGIAELRDGVAELRHTVAEQRREILAHVDGVRATVMTRIDRLADEFKQYRDETIVNLSSLERIDREHKVLRDNNSGMTEIVTALQRQIHNLASRVSELENR